MKTSNPTNTGKSRIQVQGNPDNLVNPGSMSRADIVFSLTIFVLAFCVRLIYLFQIESIPLFYHLAGDARSYDEWAQRIASGDWLGDGVFYQAPLYPYFLGLVQFIFGHDLWFLRLIQAAVGSLSCVLIFWVGRSLFSREAGMTAGLILALYAPAIFFDALIQKTVLDLVFILLLLLLLVNAQQKRHWGLWVAAGAVLGLLGLTRENALVWVLIVPIWIWFGCAEERPRRRLQWMAFFLAGILLILFPVGLRNLAAGGEFTLTTSQLGPNFFIGNNPDATGSYMPLREGHGDPRFERQDATELAEQDLGRTLSPGEVSAYWLRRSLDYIRSQPVEWLRLMGKKWMMVWNAHEREDTDDFYLYQQWSPLLKALASVSHLGFLAPLAAGGLVLTIRQWRKLWFLYALLGTLAFSVALFFIFGRYRFPMVPFLTLFAGAGLVEGFALYRERNVRRGFEGLFALVLSAALVHWPLIDQPVPSAAGYNNLANALVKQGRFEEAIEYYQTALKVDPAEADAHYNLGNLLARQKKLDEAKEQYQKAIKISPGFADPYNSLGHVLVLQGKLTEALERFRHAVELNPGRSEFRSDLGIALSQEGDLIEATRQFEEALRIQPDSAQAHYHLGIVMAARGDLIRAVENFRRAIVIQPEFAEARASLARALAEQGKRDEAIREYNEAIRILRSGAEPASPP